MRAASQLFDAEVIPNTVAVNVSAPQPAGAIHVDVPSFRGADRDRYWIISDDGTSPVRYDDPDVRISILWKAQVRPGSQGGAAAPLSPELITDIISADLARRGVQAPGRGPSLSDQGWLDLVHSTYYVP